jgi:hypothetical protein
MTIVATIIAVINQIMRMLQLRLSERRGGSAVVLAEIDVLPYISA